MQLPRLLEQLLCAEATHSHIPQGSVDVASNINAGDGGEDGRIFWNNGPGFTDYIPNRLTSFQCKATKMSPSDYKKELLTKNNLVKSIVDRVLNEGGSYIIFTTQALNTQQKHARIGKMRQAFTDAAKDYANTCDLHIYDASHIARWVNCYIPAVIAVRSWIGRPVGCGLKNYNLWSEYEELFLPFASVESRKYMIRELKEKLLEPKACFRIMGLSGLGKTRTAFQIFTESNEAKSLVVYVNANTNTNTASDIVAKVTDWITGGIKAILVVDNCELQLHESLVKEVRRENSQISLLSLDYNIDSVSAQTKVFKLERMKDEELLQLLRPVYENKFQDLPRIASFAQGFPQMAVLLVEARLSEDPRIGELTDDALLTKLLWKHGENENTEDLKMLRACSLFDVFGIEGEVEGQLAYISSVIGVGVDTLYECVERFSQRGIIDKRGRFGQVIPKPLAIRLAGQWWTRTRKKKQREFVNGIPDKMVEAFCHQVAKMDFHTDVKLLTENLCGPQGPFGQAEVILSKRGSRLLRAFVNVNPEAASASLYKILNSMEHCQLLAVDGDTRRNLVWGLERLCFHEAFFMESAWCLLLLASAENESWSNNATGMFAQLFHVQLSGTAAEPKARFGLLRQAMEANRIEIDMVILNALGQAIDIHGGSRMVGAEYQGTKAPLEEWRPKIWQEIFDYWQMAFDLLLEILKRGESQKEKVIHEIGCSIRSFVGIGRINMLDNAIKNIVEENGRYWPEALESIKNTLEYDKKGLEEPAVTALNSWLKLLGPDDATLEEKLKIVVLNPPCEYGEESDGNLTNLAEKKAQKLAVDIAGNAESLFPYIGLLLKDKQTASYAFGRQLVLELDDASALLEITLEKSVVVHPVNPSFILGLYRGIYEKNPHTWQSYIDRIVDDERLVVFYPDCIRTGNIQKPHLDVLLGLLRNEVVPASRVNVLGYGRVVDDVAPEAVADFCLELSALGSKASWSALDIISMYCLSKKGCTGKIIEPLKRLVSIVSLQEKEPVTDIYNWHRMAKKLLNDHDQDFATALSNQIIAGCQHGFDYSALRHYIKPLLVDLLREYGDTLWPIFSKAIAQAEGMGLYRLQKLFERDNIFERDTKVPSALSALPTSSVISWCKGLPDIGPDFVAGCANILETGDETSKPSGLFVALLENFGDNERMANSLFANMISGVWSGSLVPYLQKYKSTFATLKDHENDNVRRWVREYIRRIDGQITHESNMDAEKDWGLR